MRPNNRRRRKLVIFSFFVPWTYWLPNKNMQKHGGHKACNRALDMTFQLLNSPAYGSVTQSLFIANLCQWYSKQNQACVTVFTSWKVIMKGQTQCFREVLVFWSSGNSRRPSLIMQLRRPDHVSSWKRKNQDPRVCEIIKYCVPRFMKHITPC